MNASNFLPRAFVDSLMVFERGKFLFCFCADGTKEGVTLFFCKLVLTKKQSGATGRGAVEYST